MEVTRRKIVAGMGVAGAGVGAWLVRSPSCEVACFEFYHEGFDDAPDYPTIIYTDGKDLPADEVFITGVVGDEWPPTPEGGETKPWYELDDDRDPNDSITGRSARISIGIGYDVHVLWRHGDDERILAEFTRD